MDMTENQDKGKMVPRSVVLISMLIALLCLLVMARCTDVEISNANREAREAESRSAEEIIKLIKMKDRYMRKLEELNSCSQVLLRITGNIAKDAMPIR